ncbi:white collar 2 type of transcription factor [Salvia divinorum]|uniref:White collar 2 type of transcription factor n=1 Tax=Salvia divinorum TaxID=28513 RepID=A0ABD1H1Q8_SALDI
MDKRSGNSHSRDDKFKNIDLTLKLGPSQYYSENQDEQNDDEAACEKVNDMGNWNVPYNSSSSSAAAPSTYNYLPYQGSFPHNTSTTSTRKRPMVDDTKACKACGSHATPLWRKGPDGPQTLCNACGLRHLRTVKRSAGDQ